MGSVNQKSAIEVVEAMSVNQSLSPPSSPPPSPQLFKLNVDCFEHLFEWMPLNELLVFRRTCKRMKAVVDYYIKLTYPQILRLSIYHRRHWMNFHSEHLNYLEWIKQLSIDPMDWNLDIGVNDPKIESIAYVLNRLEVLKLQNVFIDGDFYDVILRHCPLLKHLNIAPKYRGYSIIGTGNNWLFRQYQMLEHFEVHVPPTNIDPDRYTTELVEFFIQNPQIRIFSTDSDFLEHLYRRFLESQIKFDRLDMYVTSWLNTVRDLAKILYENQFYKQLHLYNNMPQLIENEAHCLSAFKNLEKLHLYSIPDDYAVPMVQSIKELSIDWFQRVPMELQPIGHMPVDILKIIGENFNNLRRVDIRCARKHDIRSFICHAPKLQQIRVVAINYIEPLTISDFKAMNEERKKLNGARKVKILIGDQDFLQFKWAGNINFSLIELKRTDMYNVDREYHWM